MKQQIKQILAGVLAVSVVFSCNLCVLAEDTAYTQEIAQVTGELNDVAEAEDEAPSEPIDDKDEHEAVVLDGVEKAKDKTILYVASDGKDSNPGTIDKPLATLDGARKKIRELKSNSNLDEGGAVVYFRGGDYTVTNNTKFQDDDSGKKGAPVIYRNYPDEEVNFIGGAKLAWSDFKQVEDKALLERIVDTNAHEHIFSVNLHALGFTDLPEQTWPGTYSYYSGMGKLLKEKYGVVKPSANSPELIVNGKGATVARYPNDGEMEIGAIIKDGNFMELEEPAEFVVNDTRIKEWGKAEEAILHGTFKYAWASLATPLGEVVEAKNSIRTKYPIYYGAATGQFFYIYNLIEELDMPGEYYIDRKKGILYIYPPEEGVEEVIYTLHTGSMLEFSGADYITVKGINMKYTRGNFINIAKGSENIQIIDCEFTYNTSDGAVVVSGSNNQLYDCYFYDCSVGVMTLVGDRPTLTRGNLTIENCKFERCDRINKTYSPAINIYQSVGVKAYHNELSQADHCILQLGGNFHDVSFNEIHHAVMSTDDMGAIYSGRNLTMRGNVYKNNYVHDIGGEAKGNIGVFAFYFDDHWECADVVGNVIANVTGAAMTGAGSYNVIHNNIMVNVGTTSGESIRITRSYDYGSAASYEPLIATVKEMPVDSKVWVEAFPEIVNVIREDGSPDINNNIVISGNVFYNSPQPNISDDAKKTITYENNVFYKEGKQDPGFFDIENEIYHLNDDSRVYTDIPGFKPIPFTRMGRYDERAITRASKGFVFCTDSPYVFNKGERVKADKNQAMVENETIYIPLRTAADAIEGNLTYDEETEKITVSGKGKLLEFVDGAANNVMVSGTGYTLSKPVVNINGTNYLAAADIANIFGMQLLHYGNLTVLSDVEGLFNLDADTNLLRYIETLLTLY